MKLNNKIAYRHAAMSIHSLGKLCVNINNLSEEMKSQVYMVAMTILIKATLKRQDENIERSVAYVIWGLAKMSCQYSNLPEHISKSMIDAAINKAPDMNTQQISNIIYS